MLRALERQAPAAFESSVAGAVAPAVAGSSAFAVPVDRDDPAGVPAPRVATVAGSSAVAVPSVDALAAASE